MTLSNGDFINARNVTAEASDEPMKTTRMIKMNERLHGFDLKTFNKNSTVRQVLRFQNYLISALRFLGRFVKFTSLFCKW
jgi:hypothetical protein